MGDERLAITIVQLLLTTGAAAVAIIPALLRMRSEKAEAEASATEALTGSALGMVEAWEKRVQKLEDKMARVEKSEDYWKRGCYRLINQLTGIGVVPCWDPNGGPASKPQEDKSDEE
jgi:hypothetical protein